MTHKGILSQYVCSVYCKNKQETYEQGMGRAEIPKRWVSSTKSQNGATVSNCISRLLINRCHYVNDAIYNYCSSDGRVEVCVCWEILFLVQSFIDEPRSVQNNCYQLSLYKKVR